MSLREMQAKGSRVETPILKVTVNRQLLPGVISADVESTGHFAADTFRVVVALDAQPAGMGIGYWSDVTNQDIEIVGGVRDTAGNPQMLSWLVGRIDDPVIDLVGRTMTLTGRDMSGLLIDTKIAEQFTDLTASQIATKIAVGHGLTPQVTATTTKAGKLYEQFHCKVGRDQTEWDLLVFLAQREGFDLYTIGKTLFFQPPAATSSDPYVLLWSDLGPGNRVANFESLTMRRSLTLADDVIVKVLSWNQKSQKPIHATLKSSAVKKSDDPTRAPQVYTYNVPNLDQSQANQYAQTKMDEISKHERVIDAALPGDNLLQVRRLVKLVGTASSFDQSYYPDRVARHISVERGYCMELKAKNHSTRNMTFL